MQGFFASSQIQKSAPGSLFAKCGACGLFKGCQSPKMPVYGKGQARILLVGEIPSEGDDEEGRPFAGKVGDLLRDVLDEHGINLDRDTWQTNALICHPTKAIDEANIDFCRPNLTRLIAERQPLVIVTLGRGALSGVLKPYWHDIGPLARWIGWQIPLAKHWVCPTFSPAFIFKSKSELVDRMFAKDIERAVELVEEPRPINAVPERIHRLYDQGEIVAAIDDLEANSEWAAFDYETNCLKPEYPKARIFAAALSNGKKTFAFPWAGEAVKRTSSFLQGKVRKIAANLKFEERWTRKFLGHGVRNWGWDTMIAAHVIDSREGITSLKFQSLVKLGVPTYNENIEPYLSSASGSKYNRMSEIAIGDLLLYNGMDSLLEFYLAMRQRKEMGYES